jgi:hypothetical protein
MRRDAEGFAIRPPKVRQDFESDLNSVEGLVQYGLFYLHRAADTAGMCMTDHLGDERAVRDMHDIIGDLSSVMSTLQLIEARTVIRPDGPPRKG